METRIARAIPRKRELKAISCRPCPGHCRLIARAIPRKRELKDIKFLMKVNGTTYIARAIPRKRELKEDSMQNPPTSPGWIARAIPRKRELKVRFSSSLCRKTKANRKGYPEEKGTESDQGLDLSGIVFVEIARAIPRKRELKDDVAAVRFFGEFARSQGLSRGKGN